MWSFVTGSLLSMFPRCNSIKHIGTLLLFIEKNICMFMHPCISLWKWELFSFFSSFSSPSIYIHALCNKHWVIIILSFGCISSYTSLREYFTASHLFLPVQPVCTVPQVRGKFCHLLVPLSHYGHWHY